MSWVTWLYAKAIPSARLLDCGIMAWTATDEPYDLQVVESLYGQDLDSGHHGSGFPLPPFRQTMLEHHLTQTADARANNKPDKTSGFASRMFTDKETAYSKHAWNINNLPRCKVRSMVNLPLMAPQTRCSSLPPPPLSLLGAHPCMR